jgi:glycerol uptake facilitator protein
MRREALETNVGYFYTQSGPSNRMNAFTGELIGTALLILLGDGVVANVLLKKTTGHGGGWIVITFGWGMAVFVGTTGHGGGWIVITFGWGMAVFVGVLVASAASGAHLNPAVSVGLAVAGKFDWGRVPAYALAQMLGACTGAFLVWLQHKAHFEATEDPQAKLAVFCTGPAIRAVPLNLVAEVIGTFVLVFAALNITSPTGGLGSLDGLPIGLVVLAIGLSLGGTTGYAINPARDLGPRFMHALLPIPGKRDSDWSYAWIPVIAPLIGGVLAAIIYRAIV